MISVGTIVSLVDIGKTYKKNGKPIKILAGFSMTISRGDIVGVLGPNGCGKTTLLKIIAGLCVQDHGRVEWHLAGDRRRHLGLVLEGRANLMERLSTLENAKYYCSLRQCDFSLGAFQQLCADLGLSDINSAVRKSSTGNKLRSALLLALVHGPTLVLLDEPTNGLDEAGVQQLEAVILSMAAKGCGFVICSHDLAFINKICQSIICLAEAE
ncbi:MAG TPA: ABC transporter ATP-binding protein [Duganella sp.]|jgi:ABC-2 type transport system ATP-binding protein